MRTRLRKLLAILDGTPTGARGQSLAELTLTLPILLVMLLGLTEIGWYANNYLTLLDVVREAGRFGASRNPMEWVPGEEKNYHRLDCEELSDRFNNSESPLGPDAVKYGYSISGEAEIGFYDGVACTAVQNMEPLEFRDDLDDVVVSVFSYYVVNKGTNSAHVRVTGRYPARTNECANDPDDVRDPFDWYPLTATADYPQGGDGLAIEAQSEDVNRFDIGQENIRGFTLRGNHQMDYGAPNPCLGSSFSTTRVEELLNFAGNPDRVEKLRRATSYGLVLVEMYWSHRQLLGLPWFNLGPIEEGQTIHVWAFFPVSAAEPDID